MESTEALVSLDETMTKCDAGLVEVLNWLSYHRGEQASSGNRIMRELHMKSEHLAPILIQLEHDRLIKGGFGKQPTDRTRERVYVISPTGIEFVASVASRRGGR